MQYAGWSNAPYLRGPIWLANEMVFGFALAVITGFLFTAVPNWTSRSTSEACNDGGCDGRFDARHDDSDRRRSYRPCVVADLWEGAEFALVSGAAIDRVFVPLLFVEADGNAVTV